MKTYEVVLTKSYIVKIKAENENLAKEFAQIYTNDISDISTTNERKEKNFEIEDIDCKINETFEITEVNENN
jgi:hypothetical protein